MEVNVTTNENDYKISFFKPSNDYTRRNRNVIITLVIIWAIAIFGFQFLLRYIEKPTPEKALTLFENVQENVLSENASLSENQDFAKSLLSVLGKVTKACERNVLDSALSWVVYGIIPAEEKSDIINSVSDIKSRKDKLSELTNSEYETEKLLIKQEERDLYLTLSDYLNLDIENDNSFDFLKAQLLPIELTSKDVSEFSEIHKAKLHGIMKIYLTHNQSILTDTIFLGFPFHYWYTAEFLLILFIFLCWVYCVRISQLHKKFNIDD